VLNALERSAGGYGGECDRLSQDLTVAESQLRDYQARLGKPFAHQGYLAELTTLRDQLKACLSATAHESSENERPSVAELVEAIKTLKAAHTIEAAPQRIRQNQSTAEEPVTTRIRRRTELTDSADSTRSNRAESRVGRNDSAPKPRMTHSERIQEERERNDWQRSPS
jgi:hypothetical protein